MTDFLSGNLCPTSLDDRRRRPRRGGHDEHQITVIDGVGAGDHLCACRELTADGASLLVRADLRAGQRVRVQQLTDGVLSGPAAQGEIIRSRPLTTGRWEVLVEFPRQAAAPKLSESQRRHERRQARVASITGVPISATVSKTI